MTVFLRFITQCLSLAQQLFTLWNRHQTEAAARNLRQRPAQWFQTHFNGQDPLPKSAPPPHTASARDPQEK